MKHIGIPLDPMLTLASTALIAAVAFIYLKRSSGNRLPPGPRPLPLVGNLFSMPSHSQWETYSKWSKKYNSDILCANVLGTSIIILTSLEAATDLLEKRSAIYSDRPRSMMLELVGGGFSFTFMKYGPTWRKHQRMFHQEFQPINVRRFRPRERSHAHKLLQNMLDNPDMFAQHIEYVIGANIMAIAYGLDCMPSNDPYIDASEAALAAMRKAVEPGRFLVDIFPLLKCIPSWVPGAGFKRTAKEWRGMVQEMVDRPFEAAKQALTAGIDHPSFVGSQLRALDETPDKFIEETDIKHVAGTIYTAGLDTSRTTMLFFMLAMMQNPDIQRKAQQEIDTVLKPGHLPDFEDQNNLPYITAIAMELRRWRPVAPIGVPHFISVEDVYRGYRIPAGSVVIANAWSILHDEDVYPDADTFKPERFLRDGKLDPNVREPDVFGFGRRTCPGQSMAVDVLWIMIASLLAVFDITKPVDEEGQPIEPPTGFISDIGLEPLPFKCAIKPRSKEAAELICSAQTA